MAGDTAVVVAAIYDKRITNEYQHASVATSTHESPCTITHNKAVGSLVDRHRRNRRR
jgi:hypothetical protein